MRKQLLVATPGSIIRTPAKEQSVRDVARSQSVDRSIGWLVACCMGQQLGRLLTRCLVPGLRPLNKAMPRDDPRSRLLGNQIASKMV